MQQAMLYSFLFMMPFALLSGLATPLSATCRAVCKLLTLLNPLRYAIEIAERVYLEGAGIERLFPELWPLAAIAVRNALRGVLALPQSTVVNLQQL